MSTPAISRAQHSCRTASLRGGSHVASESAFSLAAYTPHHSPGMSTPRHSASRRIPHDTKDTNKLRWIALRALTGSPMFGKCSDLKVSAHMCVCSPEGLPRPQRRPASPGSAVLPAWWRGIP